MGVGGKVVGRKHLVPPLHHTGIIHVDVMHEKPCAHTVVGNRAPLVFKPQGVVAEQRTGGYLRAHIGRARTPLPEMSVDAVMHREKPVVQVVDRDTLLKIGP